MSFPSQPWERQHQGTAEVSPAGFEKLGAAPLRGAQGADAAHPLLGPPMRARGRGACPLCLPLPLPCLLSGQAPTAT